MLKLILRARVAVILAIAATTLCFGLTSGANAGTGITHRECTSVADGHECITPRVNEPNWTFYTRAEMAGGYHCAWGINSFGEGAAMVCGTENYVYSSCWATESNPKWAGGLNFSGSTHNMEVWMFHKTEINDCSF